MSSTNSLMERQKKQLKQSYQLTRKDFEPDLTPLGSEEEFYKAHDILIDELSKTWSVTEEMEDMDFNLSRYDSDRLQVEAICNRYSAKILLAIIQAQKKFPQPYPVRLDCDDAEITVTSDGRIYGSTWDEGESKILKRFGF